MHDEHVMEQMPAYVLGILETDEHAAVAEHVAACSACEEELAAFLQVGAELAALVTPAVAPPEALKQRLWQAIGEAQAPAETEAPRRPQTRASAGRTWREALRDFFGGPVWRPVALALLLVIALSLILRPRPAAAPGVEAIPLVGTESVPEAYAVVVLGSHYDRTIGTLIVDNLPPLGPDQQYQLWLTDESSRFDGGAFDVGDDGYGSLTIRAPADLDTYSFGVTVEPTGGSLEPTGPRVLTSGP